MDAQRRQTNRGNFTVKRVLSVPGMPDHRSAQRIERHLAAIAGITRVATDQRRKRILLTYDASRIGFADIESALSGIGFPPAGDWRTRLRSFWYKFLDENAGINARSNPSPCCSNPTNILASRRKSRF